jgi:hypothetical protein
VRVDGILIQNVSKKRGPLKISCQILLKDDETVKVLVAQNLG